MSRLRTFSHQLDHARIIKARLLYHLACELFEDKELDAPPKPFDTHWQDYLFDVISREHHLSRDWPTVAPTTVVPSLPPLPTVICKEPTPSINQTKQNQVRVLFECDEILRRTIDPYGPPLRYRNHQVYMRLFDEKYQNKVPLAQRYHCC